MKKIYFLLLWCLQSIGYLHAQNSTGVHFSPPISRQTKGDVHSDSPANNLKVNATTNNISFINGSFEMNTGFCIINGDNQTITKNVVATTAYGCGDEIDLMSNTCGWGTAISGTYFLCLSDGDGICTDACTMELNKKLVQGQTYTICYFDRGYNINGCCPPGTPLEIGVSTKSNSQGTVVYTSPVPKNNVWSHRIVTFVAPNSGNYISFTPNGTGRWTHIDSVRIIKGDIGKLNSYTYASNEGNITNNIKISTTGFSTDLKPNPATGTTTLKVTNATGAVKIWLTNLQGKTLWQSPKSFQNIITIDVSRLGHGIFMVLVKDEKESKALRLIKK